MSFASLIRRTSGLALSAAGLFFVAGCSEEKSAPPPNITVNPLAVPAKPTGSPTNAGPGSNAAQDSTLRH